MDVNGEIARTRAASARGEGAQERRPGLLAGVRDALRRRKYGWIIRRSRLFDAPFYLSQCPDDPGARRDPVRHYLLRGAAAGLDPNPFFDTSYYLERYPDVAAKGKNPLVHFIRHGAAEGRTPSGRFDISFYVARHPDVAASGENPLAHYLARGAAEGRPCLSDARAACPVLGDLLDRAPAYASPEAARRVLVVDQHVPTPDRDSGSVRIFAILRELRRLGHEVTFVADRDAALEEHEQALWGLGIGVLYGYTAAVEHLATRGHEYAAAILSRPLSADRYLSAVRAYALRATVVYDTVDLHWVRYERAAEVTGDAAARAEAEWYHRLERLNVACSDVTLAVTERERELLLRDVPGARVEVLPNVHEGEGASRGWEARRDLLFIGGFEHAPNADAVEWFVAEVLPRVQQRLPGVVLRVVGSKAPERIRRLESPSVRVLGYVRDVPPIFEETRVFVSPLRYGAGMKGKIGQSMSLGLPVVTTSVGAEGMMIEDGAHALVADDPAAFADAVVRLYTDELLWSRLSRASVQHVRRHYSPEVAREVLSRLFARAARAAGGAAGDPSGGVVRDPP